MKSGLVGRYNIVNIPLEGTDGEVSMKSGLEGRNNEGQGIRDCQLVYCLNEVRPRRPEQLFRFRHLGPEYSRVSMKSGLEGRNNRVRRHPRA